MAARLAFSRFSPSLKHTRLWPSTPCRFALARGYASSSEHQVSRVRKFIDIRFKLEQRVDDRS